MYQLLCERLCPRHAQKFNTIIIYIKELRRLRNLQIRDCLKNDFLLNIVLKQVLDV